MKEISISPPAPLFKFTSFLTFCTRQDLKERIVTVDDENADDKVDLRQSEPEMRKATDLSGSAVMGTAVIFLLISSFCIVHQEGEATKTQCQPFLTIEHFGASCQRKELN